MSLKRAFFLFLNYAWVHFSRFRIIVLARLRQTSRAFLYLYAPSGDVPAVAVLPNQPLDFRATPMS
jgi:hypothetical protein